MKKILHTIETSGPGGAENFLIRTAQSLGENYNSIVLLLKAGWLPDRLLELGFPVFIENLNRSLSPSWFFNVAKLLRKEHVDVIHSHEFTMNVYMSLLAKMLNVKHIATVHGKNYYGDRAIRRAAYRLVSRFSIVVAVSEDIKRQLVESVGIEEHRVTVIPNGIEVGEYQAGLDDKEKVRATLGYGEDDYLICAIGNLYPVKGHSYLVAAIGDLVEKYGNIRLVVAGRGGEQEALSEQIDRLGIQNHVSLLGFRDDVKSILLCSDLFVMPSLSEGLPLSLLEAMAANIPVVVTSVGGMPQVVDHGRTGLLVPPADSAALARTIEVLLTDEHAANRFADEALAEVIEKYSMRSMLDSYKQLYEST